MKTKLFATIFLCSLSIVAVYAGKKVTKTEAVPEQVAQQDETPVITEECLTNISLFAESAKNKQYADAVGPWYEAFNNCPNASLAIYTYGDDILGWEFANAKTAEEKDRIRNTLMQMYDLRIKYFGDNKKYPTAYILGDKAMDYIQYFPEDKLKTQAYEWLAQSVDGMGTKSKVTVIQQFMYVSLAQFKEDATKQAQYIADYQKASDVLNKIAEDASAKEATRNNARIVKEEIDNMFAASGAADCDKMDEIYRSVVEANADNLELLNKIMTLYQRVNCRESEVYFAAAVAAHKIQPTAESAAGCAAMSVKKGDNEQAITYYKEALDMTDDNASKADYLYNIAFLYYNSKNYVNCRSFARQSLEYDGNQGRCYILIGLAYISGPKPYDDAILNRSVYWVAVDKFNKAAAVDPEAAATANKYAADYKKYFPSTEDIFYSPDLKKGEPFTVGGWIGETTIVRSND